MGDYRCFNNDSDLFIKDLKEGNNEKIKSKIELFRAIVTENYERAQRVKKDLDKINPDKSEREEF